MRHKNYSLSVFQRDTPVCETSTCLAANAVTASNISQTGVTLIAHYSKTVCTQRCCVQRQQSWISWHLLPGNCHTYLTLAEFLLVTNSRNYLILLLLQFRNWLTSIVVIGFAWYIRSAPLPSAVHSPGHAYVLRKEKIHFNCYISVICSLCACMCIIRSYGFRIFRIQPFRTNAFRTVGVSKPDSNPDANPNPKPQL